ncbi:MAG: c-type cytochrome [Brevundimonas sp.]|jgi:cytochrome c|uniref:c-type cytochrome n=1 Tax=Brevundimonas sp. TaxID=1871086 RepID=UPI0022C77076|nr:cytochrome c [Brevundimonas sp.]MCZ8193836.1 cytochrome c [Brevundimonas sp.]
MRVPSKPPVRALAGLAVGLALAGCAAAAVPPVEAAGGGSVARGAALAQSRCASCHAVERSDDSPMQGAPPFRHLSDNYPVASLQEGLAEGLVTAHPGMPQFAFEPEEIRDLIAYLETL